MFLAWTGSVMYLLTNSTTESFLRSVRQSRLGMPGFTLQRVVCGALIFNRVLELGIMFSIVNVFVCWADVYKWKKIKNGWRKGTSCFFLPFFFSVWSVLPTMRRFENRNILLFDPFQCERLEGKLGCLLLALLVVSLASPCTVPHACLWLACCCCLYGVLAWCVCVGALARRGSLAHCSLCSFLGKKKLCLWSASCL